MPGRRRTQAERSAATAAAVLDATIDCLVERGYAHTTTRDVARRAGVTVGALQHHFDSKAQLMAAALQQLGARLADEFLARDLQAGGTDAQLASLLDHVWAVHRGRLFDAGVELSVAARTDPALQAALDDVARDFAGRVAAGVARLFPAAAARPGLAETVTIGLATIRGLALPGVASVVDPDDLWPLAREHLVAVLAAQLEPVAPA